MRAPSGVRDALRGAGDLREDAEARHVSRKLVELGVPAADIVATALVAGGHLDVAHRQRRPPSPHAAEAAAAALGRLEDVEVDLDVEDFLHAAHVRPAPGLVGVDERARAVETRARVHDLVAMNLTAPALDL